MDKALKQRLVGASVLIALAVIVLPMLLSGRPENAVQQSQTIELPPRPAEVNFETRRFPVTDAQENARPSATEDPAAAGQQLPTPASASPDASGAKPATAEPVAAEPADATTALQAETEPAGPATVEPSAGGGPATAATAPPPAEGGSGRYVVQVASLSSADNASRLLQTLQNKGYAVLFDVIDSEVGQLNRVRVGPFGSEAEARNAATRIDQEVQGVNPRLVDLQPGAAADTAPAGDSLARWVVQIGSFADADNAQRLVKQIRDDGLSAYSEKITSASGEVLRVRVGPFLERDEAARAQQQLSEHLAVDGVVMSAD
jgi:DedD protein